MPDSTTPDLLDLAGKLVGVWGGGLASFLAWRQWRRERNPLSITIGPGSDSADPAAPAFRVRVANRGPRRVTRREIRAAFRDGWLVESIEPEWLETRLPEGRVHAWLARIVRLPAAS